VYNRGPEFSITSTGYADATNTGDYRLFTGHLSTSNYLFMDGHVKALRPSGTMNATTNMWRRDGALYTGGSLTNATANIRYSESLMEN
jgi:prepilin-type processing-associated H-X9-DG protein